MRKLVLSALVCFHVASNLAAAGVPAEFEKQQFVVLNWAEESAQFLESYAGIIRTATENSELILLAPDVRQYFHARGVLARAGVDTRKVHFILTPFDTIWVRDYGPILTRTKQGMTILVDPDYEPPERSHDDAVPTAIADLLGLPVVRVPITLDGGGILSNGKGLCLVSRIIFEQNAHRDYDEQAVKTVLKEFFGFDQVVFVDPLEDEPTGHLDMFASFTSPDTIVIGSYDPTMDERNAKVLDDIADQLSQLRTSAGLLNVVRIPMPSNEDGVWRTYTNTVFINQVLLVPSYPSCDENVERVAFNLYRQLLPEWTIKPIPCDALIRLGGGIHCVAMNIAEASAEGTVSAPIKLKPHRVLAHAWKNLWRDDPFYNARRASIYDQDGVVDPVAPLFQFDPPGLPDFPRFIP